MADKKRRVQQSCWSRPAKPSRSPAPKLWKKHWARGRTAPSLIK
ncbi:hypothetical protein [[Clostridium] innocuum]|nr:hypothetical protein [[Clostridium] innocuum]